MSKTPTPKHTDRYKARVPNFGKILESEYPPVKSKTPTQNDWEDEIKDMLCDAGLKPIHFKLNNSGVRILNRIKKELADARKEVIDEIYKMRITDLPNSIRFVTQDAPDGDLVDGTTWNAILESIMMALRKETK